MTAILDSLCRELRNYFIRAEHTGTWVIDGGALLPPVPMANGQYYCVEGSVFNDGVHRWPEDTLIDETFEGTVYTMAVPPGFAALAEDIATYRARLDEYAASHGGFQSESFEGYSYTLPSDAPAELRELRDRILAGKRQWRKLL